MAFLMKKYPSDASFVRLNDSLANQDLIRDIQAYSGYSNDVFYSEICEILKKDKFLNEKSSLLKTVISLDFINIDFFEEPFFFEKSNQLIITKKKPFYYKWKIILMLLL